MAKLHRWQKFFASLFTQSSETFTEPTELLRFRSKP